MKVTAIVSIPRQGGASEALARKTAKPRGTTDKTPPSAFRLEHPSTRPTAPISTSTTPTSTSASNSVATTIRATTTAAAGGGMSPCVTSDAGSPVDPRQVCIAHITLEPLFR